MSVFTICRSSHVYLFLTVYVFFPLLICGITLRLDTCITNMRNKTNLTPRNAINHAKIFTGSVRNSLFSVQTSSEHYLLVSAQCLDFAGGSVVKNLPANTGDMGLIPGSGRFPGEGNGIPLQYSCLENPMDRRACRARVQGVVNSQTRLSDRVCTLLCLGPRMYFAVLSVERPQKNRKGKPNSCIKQLVQQRKSIIAVVKQLTQLEKGMAY